MLEIFHLEISGNDLSDEHPKNKKLRLLTFIKFQLVYQVMI